MQQRTVHLRSLSGWGLVGGAAMLLVGCAQTPQTAEQVPASQSVAEVAPPVIAAEPVETVAAAEAEPQPQSENLVDATPKRLVQAARYGEVSLLNYLLDGGMDINSKDAYGDTALIAAAGNGRAVIVKLLLDRGAKINLTNDEAHTALMSAAARGDYELVHTLIGAGADVNVKNNQGETALFLATQYGHPSTVKVLLNAAANPNLQNTIPANKANSGFTPLMYAATHGLTREAVDWSAVTQLLLENGANPNLNNTHGESALVFARNRQDEVIVALLKQAGAKDDQAYVGLSPDEALIKAARLGDSIKGKQLLSNGANVNAVDRNGVTPLLAAAHEGRLPLIEQLVTAGAEINFVPLGLREFAMSRSSAPLSERELMAAASRGDTALIAAGRAGHIEVVDYLLQHDAKFDVANRQGEVVLFIAAAQGDQVLVKKLLDHGADANSLEQGNRASHLSLARSAMGRDSVLIRAAQQGHLEVVRLLLGAGADVNHRGFMGRTALYSAVENGRMGVAGVLLEQGANAGQASMAGITPVMEAAKSGNPRLIQALLDKGADINIIERPELGYASDTDGSAGMTALMFAARGGHQAAVELLLKAGAQATVTNANGKRAVDEARDNGYDNVVQLFNSGNAVTAQTTVNKDSVKMSGDSSNSELVVRKYQSK